jgi:hypothetical protein
VTLERRLAWLSTPKKEKKRKEKKEIMTTSLHVSCIILQGTCHNWSDEHCINFLKNCNKALQQNGKVIIIDLVLPDAPESTDGAKFVLPLIISCLLPLEGRKELRRSSRP